MSVRLVDCDNVVQKSGNQHNDMISSAQRMDAFTTLCDPFLPRGSYAKRGICRRRVSVCVCLCVCHTPVLYQNG